MSSGLVKGRDVWKMAKRDDRPDRVAAGAGNQPRDVDAPAATIDSGIRQAEWVDGRPATTIAGDSRVFQPGGHHEPGQQSQNAVRVSVQEASILQSFPPDYPWQGSRTKQYEQIGNAVPPTMAQAVLGALLDSDCARLTGGSRSFPVDPGSSGGVGS